MSQRKGLWRRAAQLADRLEYRVGAGCSRCSIRFVAERIDDRQLSDSRSVVHVLGIKPVATRFQRGGDDQAVPEAERVVLAQITGRVMKREAWAYDSAAALEAADVVHLLLLGTDLATKEIRAYFGNDLFADYDGKLGEDQFRRPPVRLNVIRGGIEQRIQPDVRIDEPLGAHAPPCAPEARANS